MSFTYEIKETLNDYKGIIYKMIELKIISLNGLFIQRAFPYVVLVDDGVNQVTGFETFFSGNQKEVIVYFTIDAFDNFSSSSDLIFGYGDFPDENTISGVDVTSIDTLPLELSIIPNIPADNIWLSTL